MALRVLAYIVMLYLPLMKERHPDLRSVHDLTSFSETEMVNFIEQAEARGEAKGRQEGLAEAVLRMLTRKFGGVPSDVRARVVAADVESLSHWIDRILTASSLPKVFRNGGTARR